MNDDGDTLYEIDFKWLLTEHYSVYAKSSKEGIKRIFDESIGTDNVEKEQGVAQVYNESGELVYDGDTDGGD